MRSRGCDEDVTGINEHDAADHEMLVDDILLIGYVEMFVHAMNTPAPADDSIDESKTYDSTRYNVMMATHTLGDNSFRKQRTVHRCMVTSEHRSM